MQGELISSDLTGTANASYFHVILPSPKQKISEGYIYRTVSQRLCKRIGSEAAMLQIIT